MGIFSCHLSQSERKAFLVEQTLLLYPVFQHTLRKKVCNWKRSFYRTFSGFWISDFGTLPLLACHKKKDIWKKSKTTVSLFFCGWCVSFRFSPSFAQLPGRRAATPTKSNRKPTARNAKHSIELPRKETKFYLSIRNARRRDPRKTTSCVAVRGRKEVCRNLMINYSGENKKKHMLLFSYGSPKAVSTECENCEGVMTYRVSKYAWYWLEI